MSGATAVRLMHVVGARPNFMKIAPVMAAVDAWNESAAGASVHFAQTLVHTGQHYDRQLSQVFIDELGMPEPDEHLAVGSGSQGVQMARLLERLEVVVERHSPDLLIVPGDVNSTCAGAFIASRQGIAVAHLEAGLRSGDRSMPEEINRVIVDHIADLLLTTSGDADENLLREGLPPERIVRVGNTMVDSLFRLLSDATRSASASTARFGCAGGSFVLVTIHRPSNVDDSEQLGQLLSVLRELSQRTPVLFPMHLRTRERLDGLPSGAVDLPAGLVMCPPLGYLEFVGLMTKASVVLTDSGGVQEETSALGVPCVTIRTTTERPVTVTKGTNQLVDPYDADAILEAVGSAIVRGRSLTPPVIPLWDGHAGERVVGALAQWSHSRSSS